MKKNWILTIGIDKYYLTEQEAEFYITSINQGSKTVKIRDNMYLGSNLQSLITTEVIEEGKMIEKGKWECEKGKWHNPGSQCVCGYDFQITGNTAKLLEEKT